MRKSALLALMVLLSGCASSPPADVASTQEVPGVLTVQERTNWHFSGKLSVNTPSESRIVNVDWRKQSERSHIRLSGPFGIGDVDILVDDSGYSIRRGTQEQHFPAGTTLRIPVDDASHVVLPWGAFNSWISGIDPDSGQIIPAEGATISGWHIRVLRWQGDRPELMTMENQDVRLRLKINSWSEG